MSKFKFPPKIKIPDFAFLKTLPPQQVFNLLEIEHPQTQAVVISHLSPQQAGQILKLFEEKKSADLIFRMAHLQPVADDFLNELHDHLEEEVNKMGQLRRIQKGDGTKIIADMLNQLDEKTREEWLNQLQSKAETLHNNIKEKMFVFEDLCNLDDADIRYLLKIIPPKDWVIALKKTSDKVKKKIFSQMSASASKILEEDIEHGGKIKLSEVEAMQRLICLKFLEK